MEQIFLLCSFLLVFNVWCILVPSCNFRVEAVKSPVDRELPVHGGEIVNTWLSAQVFQVPVTMPVTNKLAEPHSFTSIGYDVLIHITEIDHSHRAARDAIRKLAYPDEVRAEITLRNGPFQTRYACLGGIGNVYIILMVMLPCKHPGRIRAAGHTKLAAYAAFVVDQNDPVCPFISGIHRAYTNALGLVAVKTWLREPVRCRLVVVLQQVNLHELLAGRQVMALLAIFYTFAGILAFGEIDHHHEFAVRDTLSCLFAVDIIHIGRLHGRFIDLDQFAVGS
jgi:hypothetical protein